MNEYALTVKETKDFILNEYITKYGDINHIVSESFFKEASSLLEEDYINGFYRTNFCDQKGLLRERFEQALALKKYRKNRRSFQFWAMLDQYEMFEAAKEQYEWRNGEKISYAAFFTVLCKTYLNHE